MRKEQVSLQLTLPPDSAECARCLERLLKSLRSRQGIEGAHISKGKPDTLCLHYEPAVVPLESLRQLVAEAGATIASHVEHLSIAVEGLKYERQSSRVEAEVARAPGVLSANAAPAGGRLVVEFDPSKTSAPAVMGVIAAAGLTVSKPHEHESGEHDHGHDHGGIFGERTELFFSIGCGVLTGVGWALQRAEVAGYIPTALFIGAYLLGGWFTVKEVFLALRSRKFEIDFLMLLAAAGAAFLGEWFEGALLLFLFTLGHALEGYALGRARKAIEALSKLVPAVALEVDDAGNEREVPVEALAIGARVRVKPNTRVPADGFVESGAGSVDQAPITGESIPVEKSPVPDLALALAQPLEVAKAHRVFAGTINGSTMMVMRVGRVAADSTLARVAKMVSEAETQKSPTQVFTARFERIFVPVILAAVGLLLFAWVVVDEPFAKSFYRAMAVLVAASPCALAIATPSAVLSAVGRAARSGVLIKGGAHLEMLGLVKIIAFDKTGTLTEGKPRLTDVLPVAGVTALELLSVAIAVEKSSDHPLASAIVNGGTDAHRLAVSRLVVSGVQAITGFGVSAKVDESDVHIGKPGLFTREGSLPSELASAIESLQEAGRTVMVVRQGQRFLGAIGVMDTPRASAAEVVRQLEVLGIEKTIMLTGDNQRVADAVAKSVGITEARGDLLPEDKVSFIAQLADDSRRVAMVGDGVNDAPAMARASVGIAMGAGGSDVALETADVALMADDLSALPFAVGLSRASRRIILQNLWVSLGMVAFLVPATIVGFAGIGLAVALHEGSTLLVVLNALRLLAFRGGPSTGAKTVKAHP